MPVSPSGLPGATMQALLAVHQPDHGQLGVRRRSSRSRYGSVYSPVAGSSRCEPARWHSPSRSATSPPSEPTLDEARVISGSRGAQRGGGQVQHQVVRPDRHDRARDLVQPAQQLDLDLLAGVVALHPGRHDQQAVGAHQRGQHAGAARQRGRHDLAADPAQPDPDPVVRCRARRPACGPAGPWSPAAPRGAAPSSAASSGAAKMSKVSAADTG